MRDIKVKILADGTAQVEEPFCFCGEHNAARLCITLNEELKTDASYYLLSFDVYGLSRRIMSNIISGADSAPACVKDGVIYCPLPEALTSTGELSVQVEAHRRDELEVKAVVKSSVFTLGFEPSVMGVDGELEEACGILPQIAAAVESLRDLKAVFGDLDDFRFAIINALGYTPSQPAMRSICNSATVSEYTRNNSEYCMTGQNISAQRPISKTARRGSSASRTRFWRLRRSVRAHEQAQIYMARGGDAERTAEQLYRSRLFAVLGYTVDRHGLQVRRKQRC